jgi:hypothetical protein
MQPSKMTCAALQAALTALAQDTRGSKGQLVSRLEAAQAWAAAGDTDTAAEPAQAAAAAAADGDECEAAGGGGSGRAGRRRQPAGGRRGRAAAAADGTDDRAGRGSSEDELDKAEAKQAARLSGEEEDLGLCRCS